MPTQSTHYETDLYSILFPNDEPYIDRRTNKSAWDFTAAKAIARNVAMKHRVTVHLAKVEEPINNESSFDTIINYVDSLKGKALTATLEHFGLPKGGDAVASKRVRLVQYLTKHGINQ